MRWSHVDWERKRIRVQVPKLEHIPGKGERIIPIFAALEPYLLEAFETAEDDNDRMVQINGETDTHVRRIVLRAVKRSGVTQWGQLFNALRASCETDLMQDHPIHTVCR